jgi:hypothetical protein
MGRSPVVIFEQDFHHFAQRSALFIHEINHIRLNPLSSIRNSLILLSMVDLHPFDSAPPAPTQRTQTQSASGDPGARLR